MLDGTFITVTSFKNFQGKAPFVIGAVLLCAKEPKNTYDTEAIKVFSKGGQAAGYVANSNVTKANGTMSAARIYDHVGNLFLVEVCFTTQSKIICQVICSDLKDRSVLDEFQRGKTAADAFAEI